GQPGLTCSISGHGCSAPFVEMAESSRHGRLTVKVANRRSEHKILYCLHSERPSPPRPVAENRSPHNGGTRHIRGSCLMTSEDRDALTRETVDLCSELIRFDTSNFGGGESYGERACAEWVAARLDEAGYQPTVLESLPGRASTVVRIAGADPTAEGLLVHGHLDVVPA